MFYKIISLTFKKTSNLNKSDQLFMVDRLWLSHYIQFYSPAYAETNANKAYAITVRIAEKV